MESGMLHAVAATILHRVQARSAALYSETSEINKDVQTDDLHLKFLQFAALLLCKKKNIIIKTIRATECTCLLLFAENDVYFTVKIY